MAYIGNNPDSILQGRKALYTITATANQTAFSGLDDNGNTIDLLQAESNHVYLNGSRLVDTADFTLNGDVLTLTSGAASGDIMVITTEQEMGHASSYTKAAADSRYINYDGDIVNGTIQMGGGPGNNITFADNNKIVMGTGNDLEIYHSGTNSYIDDVGEGSLFLRSGTTYIQNAAGTKTSILTNAGAGQTLYHNNTPVFETTATGIDVTGNVVVSGTVDGRDVATDGTKLDTVETNADVTDTANVAAAGALMTTGGTMTGAITSELDLAAIAKDISTTASDVFIYDTRKDSDGGAWRKRTQHTSWYNETLNTATRGSRREFPAVAVIVCESDKVTIHDGDDPNMPMWMVCTVSSNNFWIRSGAANRHAVAMNGIMLVGTNGGAIANSLLSRMDFLRDRVERHFDGGTHQIDSQGIIKRNNTFVITSNGAQNIVSRYVNDVAMTVLPNAPIDSATGLPVPTIAAATNSGVSVIKDDGTVVDITGTSQGSDMPVDQISFVGNHSVLFSHRYASEVSTIPTTDSSAAYYNGLPTFTGRITNSISHDDDTHLAALSSDNNIESIAIDADNAVSKSVSGVSRHNHFAIAGDPDRLSCFITSDYNTGWMNGDIKLATLSDTDTANVTGGTQPDRSVNNNAINVTGTIAKTAVATGADLVAYSGFSNGTNYLFQPYNSDLDFGTGDFSIMLWFKTPDKSVAGTLFHRSSSNFGDGSWATNAVIQIEFNTSSLYGLVGTNGFSVNSGPNVPLTALSNDVWHQYAMVRRSGRIAGYIDGKFIADAANVLTTTNTTAKFYIGERPVCK